MLSRQAARVVYRCSCLRRSKLSVSVVRSFQAQSHSHSQQSTLRDGEPNVLPTTLPIGGERGSSNSLIAQFLSLIDHFSCRNHKRKSYQDFLQDFPELYAALRDRRIVLQIATSLINAGVAKHIECLLSLAYAEGACLKQNIYEQIVHSLAHGRQWSILLDVVALGRKQFGRSTARLMNWRARALVEMKCFGDLESILEDFALQGLKPSRRTYHILLEGYLRNHDIHRASKTLNDMDASGLDVDSSTYVAVANAYRGLGANIVIQRHAYRAMKDVTSSASAALLDTLVLQCLEENDLEGALFLLDSHANNVNRSMDVSRNISWPTSRTFATFFLHFANVRDKNGLSILLRLMHENNIILDSDLAVSLIHAFYAVGLESSALAVLSEVFKGTPGEKHFLNQADSTMEFLGGFQGAPTIDVFNAWIKGLLNSGGHERLHVLFQTMNAVGVAPDIVTVSNLMKPLEEHGTLKPKQLVRLWRILRDFSKTQNQRSSPLLHRFVRSIMRHLSRKVWKKSWNISAFQLRHGGRTSPRTSISDEFWSDPLAGLTRKNWMFRAIMGPDLKSLISRGVKADRAIIAMRMKYDAVFNLDMESAQSTFDEMLNLGMRPTAYHYAALMEGYTKLGDMDAANDTLRRASASGIEPNVVMHTILIVGYARMGKPEYALRAFEDMIRRGVKADFAALDAIISAFYITGKFGLARRTIIDLWPLVAPFPDELHGASLKELVHALRALRDDKKIAQANPEEKQMISLKYIRQVTSLWKDEFSS